jgi:hypothetical protein
MGDLLRSSQERAHDKGSERAIPMTAAICARRVSEATARSPLAGTHAGQEVTPRVFQTGMASGRWDPLGRPHILEGFENTISALWRNPRTHWPPSILDPTPHLVPRRTPLHDHPALSAPANT